MPLYQNISITDDCFDEISNHSYKSKYSKGIFDFIEKINNFVESKKVNNINFEECCSHTTEESDTRLKQFKGQLAVKNCKGQKEVASWHTRINNDFRLYFTLDIENNKILAAPSTSAYIVDAGTLPYGAATGPMDLPSYDRKETYTSSLAWFSQAGLAVKTYLSDRFNNWLTPNGSTEQQGGLMQLQR